MSNTTEPQQEIEQINQQIALVAGQPFIELPKDLYIPPEALEVFLDHFEGPLDLLLYLIKKHRIDILDIPIAEITRQYAEYIAMMQKHSLELAADYLLMAALLAEIKSRMLLPTPASENEDEDDPRAELVRRLQEYERFKKVALELNELPILGRDSFTATAAPPEMEQTQPLPDLLWHDLVTTFKAVMERAEMNQHHRIMGEALSVRERMSTILEQLQQHPSLPLQALFSAEEGKSGLVVAFIATLELLRSGAIELIQVKPFAPIYLKPASGEKHD
ncbi:MAG: segregation/condensation protein A [Gammaproteobacteria bacterium]|nr:segregation/condensation protein A [Gammaproteobacteria bacterium]